jgi:hypothetical protein
LGNTKGKSVLKIESFDDGNYFFKSQPGFEFAGEAAAFYGNRLRGHRTLDFTAVELAAT